MRLAEAGDGIVCGAGYTFGNAWVAGMTTGPNPTVILGVQAVVFMVTLLDARSS